MKEGFAVVVDIGKTRSKVTLWSREGIMLEKRSRANLPCEIDGVACLDVAGIASLIDESLSCFSDHPVEYIVPVAHGAGVAAIRNGELAYPPLDYEAEPPAEVVTAYREMRSPFAETGSPILPAGLNFGIQLLWAEHLHGSKVSDSTLVPWAQYWAWHLSGEASSEVSSFGCHSDLWNVAEGNYSTLARERGWADRFAPIRRAQDQVGTLRPQLAKRTGLSPNVKVLAGLHDSNAALLAARGFAEIEDNEATVLSTGTWFIGMRLTRTPLSLADMPEARDCFANVDPFGRPVPSARFMGGREIETLIEIDTRQVDIKPDQPRLLAAVPAVLEKKAMVLPTLAPGNGPFPNAKGGWLNRPEDWFERRAAACIYAALVTNQSLTLLGSEQRLLVEGRFAEAEVFVRALASLQPDMTVYIANAHNDVSFGAIRLINPSLRPLGSLRKIAPLDEDLTPYADAWLDKVLVK